MLSFDSSLSNALALRNTTSFWVLKLYYNGEDTQAYQSDGSTANLINHLGSELVTSGGNLAPNGNWTIRDADGGSGGWSGANPPVYQDSETSSMVNSLTGDKIDAGENYTLSFEVGTATLNLAIGGGDLSGNSADETYVAAANYTAGTHTVTFQPSADATHLWFTAVIASQSNGTLDEVSLKASGYGSDETSIVVDYGTAFVAGDYIKIDSEIMKITNVSTHTLTVVRAQKGTTAARHLNNTAIYYDDWYGFSDKYREDSEDIYHGLISSWGNYQQSLNFFKFTTTAGNMTVNIINAEKAIEGGRFSDLFSSNNFANRRWELFQNTAQAGTYDTAARMIGNGIIGGDLKYDTSKASLVLLDNSSRYHKRIPYRTVDATNYANSPSNNRDAPVPMSYGDFGQDTTNGDFENHFVKSHFPAIVVDKEDSSGYVNALPDTNKSYVDINGDTQNNAVLLNQLHSNNTYMGLSNVYLQCANANTIVGNASAGSDDTPGTDDENLIKIKGNSFFGYFDFESASDSAGLTIGELTDRDFSTNESFGVSNGEDEMSLRFPKIPKVGMLTANSKVDIIVNIATISGTAPTHFRVEAPNTSTNEVDISHATGTQTVAAFHTSAFDATDRESLDLTDTDMVVSIKRTSGTTFAAIAQMGLQVEFKPDQNFTRPVFQREVIYTGEVNDPGGYKIVNTEVGTALTGQNLDYIYYSGKGREYGAWVDADSRINGYNEAALIENPVYIIEDILRNECGLTSTQIDHATFDTSGNTTNGHIDDAFNDAIGDIKFAFSNYKFINSKELIEGIGRQCCSYVFLGGDGKFRIKTLRRTDDYDSENKIINYDDIDLKGISKTPISDVKNDVTINYAFDYQSESFTASKNSTDATSYGTGTSGINQTLKLKMDAFGILDDDTATQLADAYKTLFKDQKPALDFVCLTPKYNELEIGDIIKFSNWDSKIKIYGTAMGTDYYMVQSISKSPQTSSIKAIKVS